MTSLDKFSCSELQKEIQNRRKAKEQEINKKYKSIEKQIKDQFREFRQMDKKLPNGYHLGDLIRNRCGYDFDCASNFYAFISSIEQNSIYGRDYSQEYATKVLNAMAVDITPPMFLDFWESSVLVELDLKRKDEIVRLY